MRRTIVSLSPMFIRQIIVGALLGGEREGEQRRRGGPCEVFEFLWRRRALFSFRFVSNTHHTLFSILSRKREGCVVSSFRTPRQKKMKNKNITALHSCPLAVPVCS
ncbi:unnamed protein product [Hapterophycus canaliculatus]